MRKLKTISNSVSAAKPRQAGRKAVVYRDNPPTRAADWIGARIVIPPEPAADKVAGGIVFHIFRASSDPALFAIADRAKPKTFPPAPNGGTWQLFKKVPEIGRRRVGFSETQAKADIARYGYHLASIRS
jgi:hypothetical protein